MPTLIRFVSVATLAIAGWLVSVVVLVLPARDPAAIGFWTLVAIGAAGFGGLSIVVTDGRFRHRSITVIVLAVGAALLALAALVLGWISMLAARGPHFEGYLFAIGAVFAIHGALVILWLLARLVTVLDHPRAKPPPWKWD